MAATSSGIKYKWKVSPRCGTQCRCSTGALSVLSQARKPRVHRLAECYDAGTRAFFGNERREHRITGECKVRKREN